MANKQGKYAAFKDWLIWCRLESPNTAKNVVSYLRQLENNVLVYKYKPHGELHRIHQALNDIDAGNYNISIEEIIECLGDYYKTIVNEKGSTTQSVLTINGYQRAFNLYLKFLSDVTDCFDMAMARRINGRIDVGGKPGKNKNIDPKDANYQKLLKVFKTGLYKPLIKLTNIHKIVDTVLDELSEAVDTLIATNGRYAVPTQFIVGNNQGIQIGDWRATIIDNINVDLDPYDYYHPKHITFKVIRRQPIKRTAEIFSEILYRSLLLQDELNRYVDSEKDEVADIKETIKMLQSSESAMRNTTSLVNGVIRIKELLRDYAKCYEVITGVIHP